MLMRSNKYNSFVVITFEPGSSTPWTKYILFEKQRHWKFPLSEIYHNFFIYSYFICLRILKNKIRFSTYWLRNYHTGCRKCNLSYLKTTTKSLKNNSSFALNISRYLNMSRFDYILKTVKCVKKIFLCYFTNYNIPNT